MEKNKTITQITQISEIMCYLSYGLQNVKKDINNNKLSTFTSQSCKRWEKHKILQHFLKC